MKECKIVVGCRVRPLNKQELELGNSAVWRCADGSIHQEESEGAGHDDGSGRTLGEKKLVSHSYDHVFDESHDNDAVYETLALPIIKGVLDGFHGTVFAYGQTSSGKTHTLLGVPEEMGIILHSVYDIFDHIFKAPPEEEYLIRVSYMEIYNEELRDLLSGTGEKKKGSKNGGGLRIVDDPKKGCEIKGLKEVVVLSPDHVLQLLKTGEEQRHYGATLMNYTSSRSHTVFRLVVESRVGVTATSTEEKESEGNEKKKKQLTKRASSITSKEATEDQAVQTATLNLVDLAGSERVSKTGATGSLLKEGAAINKSLLVLGTVINKLAEGSRGHIPFRDSKLTRLLKNSLGGNARTAVVCALSPAQRNLEESKSTLMFASRAKTIVNKAVKNHLNDKSALLDQYRSEIEELKLKLASGNYSVTEAPELDTVRQQLEAEASRRAELEEKYEQVHLDKEKKREELETMRKLTLLTSKAAANPSLAGQVQTMMMSLTSGERTAQEVIAEVEALHKKAEEEEQEAFESGTTDKVVSFSQLGRILGVKKTAPGQKRHISTLAQGIVASISQARQSEEAMSASNLVDEHFKAKEEKMIQEIQALKDELGAARERNRQLEAQGKASEAECEKARSQRDEAVAAEQAGAVKMAQLAQKLESERSSADGQNKAHLTAVKSHEQELKSLLERLEQQQAESSAQETIRAQQLQRLEQQAAEYQGKIAALEQFSIQADELSKALAHSNQSLGEEEARANAAEEATKDAQARAGQAEARRAEVERKIAAQETELESLKQEREAKVRAEEHGAALEAMIQSMTAQIEALGAELEDKSRAESSAAAAAAAAQVAASHRQQREDSLLEEVESLKRQLGAAESNMVFQKPGAGWEIESLRRELEDAVASQEKLEYELEAAKRQLGDNAAEHGKLADQNALLEAQLSRSRSDLSSRESELQVALSGLHELNLRVEDQLAQYQRALNEERHAAQASSRQAKAATERAQDMEHELRLVQADATKATETFLRYQKTAEARELHLTSLLASGKHRELQSPTSRSNGSGIGVDIRTRMSDIKAQLSGSCGPGGDGATKTLKRTQYASSNEIQRLREQLSSAKDELDVFRRLDVYSVSLKRGMGKVRAAKATPDTYAAAALRQRLRTSSSAYGKLDPDLVAKRNRLLQLQKS